MWRPHPNSNKRLRTPAKRGDDAFFPFSTSIARATSSEYQTLPHTYAENMHAPFEVAKNMCYMQSAATRNIEMNTPGLVEIVGEGDPKNTPRHFFQEEAWKTLTKNDIDYGFGFTDAVFNGFRKEARIHNVRLRDRPALEKTEFDPIPGEPPINEELPSPQEYEARAHLESFKEQRVLWAGCPQTWHVTTLSDGHHCCMESPRSRLYGSPEKRRKHNFDYLHRRIECPKNVGVHPIVGNLNLAAKTANGQSYTHCYSIRSDYRGHLNRQIGRVLRQNSLDSYTILRNNNRIAEWEFGVLEEDSGIQMSLANERRRKMRHQTQPFLSSSFSYNDEAKKLSKSLPGPPLANPSQCYNFAAFRQRQIRLRYWRDDRVIFPSPITNRGEI